MFVNLTALTELPDSQLRRVQFHAGLCDDRELFDEIDRLLLSDEGFWPPTAAAGPYRKLERLSRDRNEGQRVSSPVTPEGRRYPNAIR